MYWVIQGFNNKDYFCFGICQRQIFVSLSLVLFSIGGNMYPMSPSHKHTYTSTHISTPLSFYSLKVPAVAFRSCSTWGLCLLQWHKLNTESCVIEEQNVLQPPDIQSSRTSRQMYQQTDRQSGARIKLHPLWQTRRRTELSSHTPCVEQDNCFTWLSDANNLEICTWSQNKSVNPKARKIYNLQLIILTESGGHLKGASWVVGITAVIFWLTTLIISWLWLIIVFCFSELAVICVHFVVFLCVCTIY